MRKAVGFNPGQSMLAGLRGTPAYGKAMSAASQMNLEAQTANSKQMLEEAQQTDQRESKSDGIKAQASSQNRNRLAKKQSNQIDQAKALSGNKAINNHMNRKDSMDTKNTIVNGLLS